MPDDESSPLLSKDQDRENAGDNERAGSSASETTPLLSTATSTYAGDQDSSDRDAASIGAASAGSSSRNSASSTQSDQKSPRWASYIAMAILAILAIVIIVAAFIVPDAVQEYAKQAAVLEPTNLSLDSITTDGINARIQANFRLEASRVESDYVRNVGRAATWIANQLQTDQTKVAVALPDYNNTLLGTTILPPLILNLRDGQTTALDFVAELRPGQVEGLRQIANDWLVGRLDFIRLQGTTDLTLRSGLVPLGTHTIAEIMVFEAKNIPTMPAYNITRLNVKDVPASGNQSAMAAEVSLEAYNSHPVELTIPELSFEILVPGCTKDPNIVVADAMTSAVHVTPRADVEVNVHGLIHKLPESLTRACPDTGSSPLDALLSQYMNGYPATLFVRGSSRPSANTPTWITNILSSVTLPVPFPGRSLDGLLRNFSLTDVHFSLPDPSAEPGEPASNPRVSGTVLVIAGLPSEMNFGINVTKVRALADVYYKTDKLGELNLDQWQPANSTRVEAKDGHEATLKVESRITDAPLNVTDSDVFADVLTKLIFGGTQVDLDIKASVDIKIETVLGQLVLKKVPAEGKVPVKPISGGKDSLADLAPEVGSVRILDTSWSSITLEAEVNATNPTAYTAHVPYVNIHVLSQDTVLGEASVENLDIRTGVNSNIVVTATWNPYMSGEEGRHVGRNLISQYLSGFNTSITIKAHQHSIPGQPILCEALSRFNLTFATPKLDLPGDTPDEKSHFIRDATFHVFSSTATFTLVSPLHHNTIYIDYVNATALYNHTHPVGHILHTLPFEAPPGKSETPRLPVEWSAGSIGYDALRRAIGGQLKLDARADLDIRLGNWKESLWYEGKGIGAAISL